MSQSSYGWQLTVETVLLGVILLSSAGAGASQPEQGEWMKNPNYPLSVSITATEGQGDSGRSHPYGEKIDYLDGKVKQLPDFVIRFLGERRVASSKYPRAITVYDFEVSKGGEKKTISWSSGTGDIGPTFFEVGGQSFVLELEASDVYKGMMKQGEMIVWRRAEYERKLKEKQR